MAAVRILPSQQRAAVVLFYLDACPCRGRRGPGSCTLHRADPRAPGARETRRTLAEGVVDRVAESRRRAPDGEAGGGEPALRDRPVDWTRSFSATRPSERSSAGRGRVAVVAVVLIGLAAWVAGQTPRSDLSLRCPRDRVSQPFILSARSLRRPCRSGACCASPWGPITTVRHQSRPDDQRGHTAGQGRPHVGQAWWDPASCASRVAHRGRPGRPGVRVLHRQCRRPGVFRDGDIPRPDRGDGHGPGQLVWAVHVAVDSRGGTTSRTTRPGRSPFAASGELDGRIGHGETSDPDLTGTSTSPASTRPDAWSRRTTTPARSSGSRRVATRWTSSAPARVVPIGGDGALSGDFPDGACDTATGPGPFGYVISCQDRPHRSTGSRSSTPCSVWSGGGTTRRSRQPRCSWWTGTAVVVGGDGSILEFEVGLSWG